MDQAFDRPYPPLRPGDFQPEYGYDPPPFARHDRLRLHVILLVLTVLSTTLVGGCHFASFAAGFQAPPAAAPPEVLPPMSYAQGFGFALAFSLTTMFRLMTDAQFMLHGLWYSVPILAILGCHEMGHYLACRYYDVDASLPYFLPAPLPYTGTLGAVIRIRQRIPSKIALFDIGIAGPIAGFLVMLPLLYAGMLMSRVEPMPEITEGSTVMWLGEPLLFKAASWLVFGSLSSDVTVNLHPMAFAAWFGLLATALNLFPIGQLDGGHVTYAVLGRRSSLVTVVMVCGAIGLTFYSTSWMVWTFLMVVMLFAMGPHHPPTLDDDMPLGPGRLAIALFGLVMLILCFTPAPIELLAPQ